MFSLNISCPLCKAAFKETDIIYSTSCGHVFHSSCMDKWKSNSRNCPLCKSCNPTVYRLYINYEDGFEYESVVNGLKAKLESYKVKNKQLEEEIGKKLKEKDGIQRLYNVSEQWRAELEDKVQVLKQEKQQQDEHSLELAKHLDNIARPKANIEVMEEDDIVNGLTDKLAQVVGESIKLRNKLSESEKMKIQLNQKLEMQEHRLKHLTLELAKQIDERFKKPNAVPALETTKPPPPPAAATKPRKRYRSRPKKISNIVKSMESLNITNDSASMSDITNDEAISLTQPNDCRIVIIDFPLIYLAQPLKNTIVLLASKLGICIKLDDILYTRIMHSQKRRYNFKVVLVAEFKDIEIKNQFLKFQNRLIFDLNFQNIKIREYIDKDCHKLFLYANQKLHHNGYEYIACKDRKIVAKKRLHDTEEIIIQDQHHVDTLLRSVIQP